MDSIHAQEKSKDIIVLLLGVLLVFFIGGYWFFREYSKNHALQKSEVSSQIEDVFKRISSKDLKKSVLQKKEAETMVIVDIRPLSTWKEGHIIGSKSLMLEDAKKSFYPTEEDKNRTWCIVSPTTEDALTFAALMRDRGIFEENILFFEGTFDSWKQDTGLVIKSADPTSPLDIAKVRLLQPLEAKKTIDGGGRWFILDVRSPEDFQKNHVYGATNIPFLELEEKRAMIPSTAKIFTYGSGDYESFSAGVLLFDLGFFDTVTLSGSFDDWKKNNLPVVKSAQ